MPGIVGLITKAPRERAEAQLSRMVEAICHESFYETGTWVDESLGVYVGWAHRKESFCEGMPLLNEQGNIALVFSGEEYPEPGTKARLEQGGHSLSAQSPASYLVHLYEENPNFLVDLNGMFHGLLADRTRGTVVLFNDRYGMHRLYYHESSEALYFAAEAKALLAVLPQLRTPDLRSLGEFVTCSCVLEDRTIFKGVGVLPPAAAWAFRAGFLERKAQYFDPREWENQDPLDPEAYYRAVRDAFTNNLPRYFNGEHRVGLALTGGLDTRAIMAWRKPEPNTLSCYTFGGMRRDCQDVRLARRVASICSQPHEVITVGEEFLARFPHYAERTAYLTEGCVDISNSPDLYISERARKISPVKVVGTYGSEIICQAVMFKPTIPVEGLFSSELMAYVDQGRRSYAQLRQQHPVTVVAIRQSQWHHYGVFALEQTQVGVRPPFLANDFVRAAYGAPKYPDGGVKDVRPRMIQEGNAALGQLRSDRGVGGNSPIAAAVARGFLEFTFKAEYAYDYGMPQWVAGVDHLLSPFHLERLFLGRHKFAHFRVWYRDSLAEYVRQILLDPLTLTRPYINRKVLMSTVNSHLEGKRNYTCTIHTLLTLELLHRLFFDAR
jgi:asparagine synthase (glutamine-hydrolysing)